MSGRGTRSILKRNTNRKTTVKANKRIRFNNSRTMGAVGLTTPAHVTGFNRRSPSSLSQGWQTRNERAAAAFNARIQKILNIQHGRYVEPYAYRDPGFVYPLESRGNMAKVASNLAAMNSAGMTLMNPKGRTRRH